jgi:hypothetical protein
MQIGDRRKTPWYSILEGLFLGWNLLHDFSEGVGEAEASAFDAVGELVVFNRRGFVCHVGCGLSSLSARVER